MLPPRLSLSLVPHANAEADGLPEWRGSSGDWEESGDWEASLTRYATWAARDDTGVDAVEVEAPPAPPAPPPAI